MFIVKTIKIIKNYNKSCKLFFQEQLMGFNIYWVQKMEELHNFIHY